MEVLPESHGVPAIEWGRRKANGTALLIAYYRISAYRDIGNWLMNVTNGNLILFLLITNIILLIAGCVMDAVSALYIFTPILLPVALEMGYDITSFGILMCVNLAIGLITPPVGVNLFTACGIAKVTIKDLIKDVLPILAGLLIVLLIVTYLPQLPMLIPNALGAK
ncbi:MAG: TRAP transporter large permease subunit [Lachnospiraceae bacterium]